MRDFFIKKISTIERSEPHRSYKVEVLVKKIMHEVNAYEKLKNSPRGPGLNSIGN